MDEERIYNVNYSMDWFIKKWEIVGGKSNEIKKLDD